MMRTSKEGRKLIELSEGRRYTAYKDSAGLWTIGVGHLIKSTEPELLTATLTDAQVDELLANDLRTAEAAVARQFPKVTRQNQFDALVSFTYNLGEGAVDRGSLDELINDGASAEAISAKWMQYIYAGGVKVPGLITRRTAEVKFYWQHLWRVATVLLIIAAACLCSAGITLIA